MESILFFEGSEKKIEVVVSGVDLLSLGDEFWAKVVEASKAQILSQISTDECKSYLLSESSLFVWSDRFTMITCGQTTLAAAAAFAINQFGKDKVDFLTFERKNELQPKEQETHFFDDVKILETVIDGKSYRFGDEAKHHVYLFYSSKPYAPPKDDVTLEILMYGLQGDARDLFNQSGHTPESLNLKTGIKDILPGFIVDDFVFDPCGYSLNALSGSDYFTIHVTPQDCSSYVSFETNAKIDMNYLPVLQRVINTFNPKAFDVVVFRTSEQEFIEVPNFEIQSATVQELNCGYIVNHCHFELATAEEQKPILKSKPAFEVGANHESN